MTIEQIKELKRKKIITHNYSNEFFAKMTLEELKRRKFITKVGFTMDEEFEENEIIEQTPIINEPTVEPIVEDVIEDEIVEDEPEVEE